MGKSSKSGALQVILQALPARLPGILLLPAVGLIFATRSEAIRADLYLKLGPIVVGREESPDSAATDRSHYAVTGTVAKGDFDNGVGVTARGDHPPVSPGNDGSLVAGTVWKDPSGHFPALAFEHEAYEAVRGDLNSSRAGIDHETGTIDTGRPVLRRIVPRGGE